MWQQMRKSPGSQASASEACLQAAIASHMLLPRRRAAVHTLLWLGLWLGVWLGLWLGLWLGYGWGYGWGYGCGYGWG